MSKQAYRSCGKFEKWGRFAEGMGREGWCVCIKAFGGVFLSGIRLDWIAFDDGHRRGVWGSR